LEFSNMEENETTEGDREDVFSWREPDFEKNSPAKNACTFTSLSWKKLLPSFVTLTKKELKTLVSCSVCFPCSLHFSGQLTKEDVFACKIWCVTCVYMQITWTGCLQPLNTTLLQRIMKIFFLGQEGYDSWGKWMRNLHTCKEYDSWGKWMRSEGEQDMIQLERKFEVCTITELSGVRV
jgi:hypothetical protein